MFDGEKYSWWININNLTFKISFITFRTHKTF